MSDRTGRFAPSPSADLHLGNLRTALLAWLYARSQGAGFVMRVEDLDRERSRPEIEQRQLADLRRLGLDWDGPVIRQSGRDELYEAALERLDTYKCWCTRREIRDAASAPHGELPEGAYPGTCSSLSAAQRAEREASGRPAAIRVRANGARVAFEDRLKGAVEGIVDDFVVRRGDGTFAYNLAVVVDDADQGVGEVVRGEDLLSSTPRQIWLARALGHTLVSYAHVPLVLGPGGQRLAKRDGAVTLGDRLALGESAEDVRGALAASVGLCEPGERPSLADLLAGFDPDSFAPGPSGPLALDLVGAQRAE